MIYKPMVFKSRIRQDWIAAYRAGQHERFPTFREAYDHAYTIARVRHLHNRGIE